MDFNAEEYLKKLHTKQLLALRDKIYKTKRDLSFLASNEQQTLDNQYGKYDVSHNFKNWYVSLKEVKAELNTQEHVPMQGKLKKLDKIR